MDIPISDRYWRDVRSQMVEMLHRKGTLYAKVTVCEVSRPLDKYSSREEACKVRSTGFMHFYNSSSTERFEPKIFSQARTLITHRQCYHDRVKLFCHHLGSKTPRRQLQVWWNSFEYSFTPPLSRCMKWREEKWAPVWSFTVYLTTSLLGIAMRSLGNKGTSATPD